VENQPKAIKEDEDNYKETGFENYLINKGFQQDKDYIRLKKDGSAEDQMW
jgi:hypothetical protein